MDVVWLLIGFVAGLLVAWLYLNARLKTQLEEREVELSAENRRTEQAMAAEKAAHDGTKRLLTDTEAAQVSAVDRAESLKADVAASHEKLESEAKEHQETKRLLSEAEAMAASAVERAEALNADLNTSRESLERLQSEDAKKAEQFDQLKSESDELKQRAEAAEAARGQHDAELQKMRSEHQAVTDDSRNRIADLQDRTGQQDEQIKQLETELAGLRLKADTPSNPAPAPVPASPPMTAVSQSPSPAGTPPPVKPESSPAPASAAGPTTDTGSAPDAGGAATPASEPSPTVSTPAASSDDLTKIKGIGPVLREKLNKLGINSFRQIADFTPDDIARVDAVLDFPGRIEREQWVEQARDFAQR